jgi:nickel-dependent lactate racemase
MGYFLSRSKEIKERSMRKLSIPYGKEKFEITLAKSNILDVIYPKETARHNSTSVLSRAIEKPVDDQTLRDFLRTRDRVLCIINDATRPTKTSAVLDAIKGDIQASSIQFLVATGAHRAPTEPELRTILGNCYGKYRNRILIHDARDDKSLEYFGRTRYGNELWLNKALKKFSKIMVIGSVEPHYFAGFTGGRKSILPGLAGYHTIERNHRFAMHPEAQPLNLVGNPVHEEMIDCVRTLDNKKLFALQMVLDRNHNIYDAFTGSIDRTFEMSAQFAARLYGTRIPVRAEIVVTVAQEPFDIDLYQTLKAIEHGRMALREGGILIVISVCPEGIGPASFSRLFRNQNSLEAAALNAQTSYRLGDHNARNLSNLIKHNEVWAITTIPQKTLSVARIRSFATGQEAIDMAIKHKGKNAKVLFMLNGCLTVPQII